MTGGGRRGASNVGQVLATVIALCMVLPAGVLLSGMASAATTASSEDAGIAEGVTDPNAMNAQPAGAISPRPLELDSPDLPNLEPLEIEPPQPSAPEEPPVLPEPKMEYPEATPLPNLVVDSVALEPDIGDA